MLRDAGDVFGVVVTRGGAEPAGNVNRKETSGKLIYI